MNGSGMRAAVLSLCLITAAAGVLHESAGTARAAGVTHDETRPASVAPRLRALLIAVAAYPEEHGYSRLNSDNDVPRMSAALQQRGFDPADIIVVQDSAATRDGILAALAALRDASQAGDVLVIHYSGHGDRITDEDGDEEDGLDELLVPYGAPYDTAGVRSGAYTGERHIRDDELEPILAGLRAAVWDAQNPGSVVVFLDACFSGSATRGDYELPSRGTTEPLGPPASTRSGAQPAGGTGFDAAVTAAGRNTDGLAPLIVFSAARDDQVAREVRDIDRTIFGSLTLAMSRVLARSTDPDLTYRGLFHLVAAEIDGMGLSQRPQVEGATDIEIFSGRSVVQRPFFTLRDVRGDTARVQGGTLVGLLPGAELAFYPSGTADPSRAAEEPLARGVVHWASEVAARVVIEGEADSALDQSWAFITRQSFGDMRIRLLLDDSVSAAQRTAVAAAVRDVTLVQIVDADPDVVLVPAGSGAAFELRTAQDDALLMESVDASSTQSLAELEAKLRTFARGKYLKDRISMNDPNVRVELSIEPVVHRFDEDGACEASDPLPHDGFRTKGGEWQLGPGDGFQIELSNTGREQAYVTVLYIMPDGRPFQLFPSPEHSGEDNRIRPGRTFTVPLCYTASRTPGAHMLKLFATRERVNFEPLIASGGATRGDVPLNPLEQIFAGVVGGRDPGVAGPPRGTGSTAALMLHIAPPR